MEEARSDEVTGYIDPVLGVEIKNIISLSDPNAVTKDIDAFEDAEWKSSETDTDCIADATTKTKADTTGLDSDNKSSDAKTDVQQALSMELEDDSTTTSELPTKEPSENADVSNDVSLASGSAENTKQSFADSDTVNNDDAIADTSSEGKTLSNISPAFQVGAFVRTNDDEVGITETAKTLEDFLFSGSSSNIATDSDCANTDEKCVPLKSFPNVVKALLTADYGLLQDLYRLLFLRNAWDTEKILTQTILDFSGFNCEPGSEDYYTRQVILHTMPVDILLRLAKVLCITNVRNLASGSEKVRIEVATRIMNFLHKPRKKQRIRHGRGSRGGGGGGGSSQPRGRGSKIQRGRQLVKATTEPMDTSCSQPSTSLDSHSPSQDSRSTSQGSISSKESDVGDSKPAEVQKDLKEKIETMKAPKVGLKRLDLSDINKILESNRITALRLQDDNETSDSNPSKDSEASSDTLIDSKDLSDSQTKSRATPTDVVPETTKVSDTTKASGGTKNNSKENISPDLAVVTTKYSEPTDASESNKNDSEKNIPPDIGTVATKISETTKASESTKNYPNENIAPDSSAETEECADAPKKKLREFPLVLSSIEGTPDKLLSEIHYLMFLEKADAKDLKERILEFDGLIFKEDSEEFKKRKDVLANMIENTVKDITRALYLDPKVDKDATVSHLLDFLNRPRDTLLKPTVIAPGMLSDCDVDIEGLSDSDDSITCEVVPKRVECIDLISSGDESDKEGKKSTKIDVKVEPVEPVIPAVVQPNVAVAAVVSVPQIEMPVEPEGPKSDKKRTLRDFETITKIVNTHPTEYLLDIYNLLYMTPYQPATLRKDILDFGGFEFEKGTPEYVKRKQFLDRMLYNSVRRIYNTLIHNTREVKVFSKPTMIGEIFQFLFKLPDTDTSIRLPLPNPNVKRYTLPVLNKDNNPQKNATNYLNMPKKDIVLPNQSGKLSELKRVFQRVACFPCEYLVDVHKLLFMTDCEMKDIRTNIFGFKGFSFGVDTSEFNQRKMYLEYLTFHSLRKISSVLTTKTVDLRNSTKHELANHLTEVLKEYTNTYFETEALGTTGTSTATTTTPQIDAINAGQNAAPQVTVTDSAVEQIVVTPYIEPLRPSPAPSPEPPAQLSKDSENRDLTVSSSTSVATPAKPSKTAKAAENKRKRSASPPPVAASSSAETLQFQDINLPDMEKYRRIYKSSEDTSSNLPKIVSTSSVSDMQQILSNVDPQPNSHFKFQPDLLLQQVPPTLAQLVSQPMQTINQPMQVPLVTTFPQTIHIQTPPYIVTQAPLPLPVQQMTTGKGDSTSPKNDPAAKRPKLLPKPGKNSHSTKVRAKKVDSTSSLEKKDDPLNTSSSLQSKIRDAMTKASEDEEDCDKPLAALVGHPNDKVLKQQICQIVEKTDLQEITINGVIQKIFNMYPQFNLNYRKEFIKSTLRSLLYRLGEQESGKDDRSSSKGLLASDSPDCSVSTTDDRDSPIPEKTSISFEQSHSEKWKKYPSTAFHSQQKS